MLAIGDHEKEMVPVTFRDEENCELVMSVHKGFRHLFKVNEFYVIHKAQIEAGRVMLHPYGMLAVAPESYQWAEAE